MSLPTPAGMTDLAQVSPPSAVLSTLPSTTGFGVAPGGTEDGAWFPAMLPPTATHEFAEGQESAGAVSIRVDSEKLAQWTPPSEVVAAMPNMVFAAASTVGTLATPLTEMPTATQWSCEVHTIELSTELRSAVRFPRSAAPPRGVRMVVVVEEVAAVPHPPITATATTATISVRSDLDRSEPGRRSWNMGRIFRWHFSRFVEIGLIIQETAYCVRLAIRLED